MAAATIVRLVRSGRPVTLTHVDVRGVLRLPRRVDVTFAVRRSRFERGLVGRSSSFGGLVDLSRTTFVRGVDFSDAQFSRPFVFASATTAAGAPSSFRFTSFSSAAIFAGARFGGDAVFTGADFHGTTRFRGVQFGGRAFFGFAGFDRAADFVTSTFAGSASFGGADFGSLSDFASADFIANTAFTGARFSGPATFDAVQFEGGSATARSTGFGSARFDGGASFLGAFFGRDAVFNLAQAPEDVDFGGATFTGLASFSTVRFLGDADFSHAEFDGFVNFDQAVLHKLDLDGADLAPKTIVVLPDRAEGVGRLDGLMLDSHDVSHIGSGTPSRARQARVKALGLVESAARSAGDRHAANAAQVQRLSLERHGRWFGLRVLDWFFLWVVSGYLIKWLHPFLVLLALLVIGTILRVVRWKLLWRRVDPLWRQLRQAFGRAWANLSKFSLGGPTGLARLETLSQKTVLLVLLLTLGNVWPPVHDLLNGLLL
jgi:uncharacterized protein YjbI with pentapeptide repeats